MKEKREKEEKEVIKRLENIGMETDTEEMIEINMHSKCKHMVQYKECEECKYDINEIQQAEQASNKRTSTIEQSLEEMKKMKSYL